MKSPSPKSRKICQQDYNPWQIPSNCFESVGWKRQSLLNCTLKIIKTVIAECPIFLSAISNEVTAEFFFLFGVAGSLFVMSKKTKHRKVSLFPTNTTWEFRAGESAHHFICILTAKLHFEDVLLSSEHLASIKSPVEFKKAKTYSWHFQEFQSPLEIFWSKEVLYIWWEMACEIWSYYKKSMS